MSYLTFEAESDLKVAAISELIPFLILLATPIPTSSSLATSTRTAGREERDEDADTDEIHLSHLVAWECVGAAYDEYLQVWWRNGNPLVLDAAFKLGTKTVTEIVKEEQDED